MPKQVEGIPEPDTAEVRTGFFAHRKEHPEPIPGEELTPLQKRMQSGGPGKHRDPGLGYSPLDG